MEDGNCANLNDGKISTTPLENLYHDLSNKLTTNGHDFGGESHDDFYVQYRHGANSVKDEKCKKRINPMRIHLGKRPFVDNSLQYYNPIKKRKLFANKTSDTLPKPPKQLPKIVDKGHYSICMQGNARLDNEQDKPVPRLVPKNQLTQYRQYKKSKVGKAPALKEYAQSLGLQPMVKFKCRKCCSMSFKTLAMLKEHQLVCSAQSKEPALSPETPPSAESACSGPSRVTKKVYLCSACGTYYENWNLFLHMREVHNRHICLFCLGMFSKAEKLSSHLTNKHNVQEFNYDSKEDFFRVYNGTLYLMCCVCDEIYSEKDDFFNHDCNNIKPKPVPVLVSKTMKLNNLKQVKTNTSASNGPLNVSKKYVPVSDKCEKDFSESKFEAVSSQSIQYSIGVNNNEQVNSDNAISDSYGTSTDTSNTTNTTDSKMDGSTVKISQENTNQYAKSGFKSISEHTPMFESQNHKHLQNGDDCLEQSNGNYSPFSDDNSLQDNSSVAKNPDLGYLCVEKEKEKDCGIKLKLSLNNANSPVIINSTVDPTVGQHNQNKPPTRIRRPPKRYEKESSQESVTALRPTIKMTICEKADSSFVKSTVYEDYRDNSLSTIYNNNLDTTLKSNELKTENNIKTTIYDNKLEDVNTLNRVPKLTVRVPKELLDRDSSSDYASDSDVSDKLTVDENSIPDSQENEAKRDLLPESQLTQENNSTVENLEFIANETHNEVKEPKTEPKDEVIDTDFNESKPEETRVIDEIPVTELTLDRPLDKYPLKELLKVFLASTVYNCIYCNHARKIAVNCEQLCLHMVAQHRFSATVDSITAEELMPETIITKVKTGAEGLRETYVNLDSYDSVDKYKEIQYDHLFECFQCYFKTAIHKDLYLHNRKMHQKTILLCIMCKTNFYTYSELLCHLCPGTYDSKYETRFRCYLCNVDCIPSSFRLMVHLRKIHHTCDVCLELCNTQLRLSNHVWKHKLHHLCYRCGIAYRNKLDITNHLFWKHGTESVLCKKCLQKKWPHVYHFCTPPSIFVCDECTLQFTKAVYLKVHKRLHSGHYPHTCDEEACSEKFVSKKLLMKHIEEHRKHQFTESVADDKLIAPSDMLKEAHGDVPVINLVDEPIKDTLSSEVKLEAGPEQSSKKSKKKKSKDKDALLLDVNLPALNLSESDSSEESDNGIPIQNERLEKPAEISDKLSTATSIDSDLTIPKLDEKGNLAENENLNDQQALEIWDNFKKYQAKVEKYKEKTPPLVPIRKHVCESDHDYCLVPTELNGSDGYSGDKKKSKRAKVKHEGFSSSSSSSSDSDSSCSCGSNCSCSSSSGSSSSSSTDSDSSHELNSERKQKKLKKSMPNRRVSNGSNVDVMGESETPILIPEQTEPLIAETDLETDESETDEEFYDEHPQQLANRLHEEKRNQLLLLASVAPSEGGSISGASRSTTPTLQHDPPVKQEEEIMQKSEIDIETPIEKYSHVQEANVEKEDDEKKLSNNKKKSKKKKKSKSSWREKKHAPIKINIPKEKIAQQEVSQLPLVPNKITISLQTNTVQVPESVKLPVSTASSTPNTANENKRASKRRRVPNKFYGYSSDEEQSQTTPTMKPHQPPKLEWRKEDLPSPVTHKTKKEVPSTTIPHRLYNYNDSYRLTTPIPDPEPPRILMNSESMESSDSDSSNDGALEIYQPNKYNPLPVPAPTYLNSGTSSLPYPFERPAIRQAKEGESVYCYCRCPYDEVSEMIGCDAEGCPIEWFHFECVGIMVPPKGKWYCPECRKNQSFSGYR